MPSLTDRRAAGRRRELNLTIAAIAAQHALTRPLGLACECGHADCWETVAIGGSAFAALQARGEPVIAEEHRDRASVPETVNGGPGLEMPAPQPVRTPVLR